MTVDIQDFLLAIRQEDGNSTTTCLKSNLGLTSSQIHYRYQLAEERDFIETHQPESDGGKPRAKVVTLTQKGDEWLRERSSREELNQETITVSREELQRLHERIDEVERRLDAQHELIQQIRRVVNYSMPFLRQLRAMIRADFFNDWNGETIDDYEYDFEY